METFFILFVMVFVPAGWFLVRALRYTDETIDENSPLYKERTYQFSASRYFLGFLKLLMAVVLVEMIGLSFILTKQVIAHTPSPFPLAWLVLVFAAFVVLLALFFYIDWQYWTITRNVSVTLNPFQPSILVDSLQYYSTLTPDNVVRIERHVKKTSTSKDPLSNYGYYLFYTNDGQITRINKIFFDDLEFLERFFSTVPNTIVYHRIPWITDYAQAGNPVAPNFAAYPER